MNKNKAKSNVFSLLKSAVTTLLSNKEILFPLCIVAFVKLLYLEILYFYPRFPLKVFFTPIIKTFWAEEYLHYPLNLFLVPTIFQNMYVQAFIYVFLTCFCIALMVSIIVKINNGDKVRMNEVLKENMPNYVHYVVIGLISFGFVILFSELYNIAIHRAIIIRSTTGPFYLLKRLVIDGAPLFNLLINIFVSVLFIYVIPIIVIEKRKVFSALWVNLKVLSKSFFYTFFVVALPSLIFLILIILNKSFSLDEQFPELKIVYLVFSIFIMFIIDGIVYTAIVMRCLLLRESE